MVVAKLSLTTPSIRLNLLKLGGVKIKGRCFIGSGVQFDGIYPNLIEIGESCVITSGTVILSHFFNTNDHCFYAGKVIIGERVFIGMNTLIVNAVNIGDDAVDRGWQYCESRHTSRRNLGGQSCKIHKEKNN